MFFTRSFARTGSLCLLLLLNLLMSGCLSDTDVWQRLNDADEDGVKACGADSNSRYCDCDDADPNIYPAHGQEPAPEEVCDKRDNNCDGNANEGLPSYAFYPDTDADGHGVTDSNQDGTPDTLYSCLTSLEGYARVSDDCNDNDNQIFPGSSAETCDRLDSIDYNCDGSLGNLDADGDRSPACADCNDANPEQWPGHLEVCDGLDNDCNGGVDDLTDPQVLYRDADTDGFGNVEDTKRFASCEQSGYVNNALDCDDTNALINPTAEELCDLLDNNCNGQLDEGLASKQLYADDDHDGYGAASKPAQACTAPAGYVENDDDCNDQEANIHPGAVESCTATVDSNCDGSVGDVDQDRDGIPACLDCNDADATVYPAYGGKPGATEKCDGIDQNCNGVNDDLSQDITLFQDADRDGYGNLAVQLSSPTCQAIGYVTNANDCDDTRASVYLGAEELCDGQDSDCDGIVPPLEADADGDGVRGCSENNRPPDCNDDPTQAGASQSPELDERCDGIDNNCNTLTDEDAQTPFYPDADEDGFGDRQSTPVYACDAPAGTVGNASDCDDLNPLVNPQAVERCDGIDNNCDAQVDEDLLTLTWPDQDQDGFGDSSVDPQAQCDFPAGTVGNGEDCDDLNPAVNPQQAELLHNGIDDNCNAETDEAYSWLYPDQDGDGYGAGEAVLTETQSVGYSPLSTDCNDDPTAQGAEMSPGQPERCDDLDNDCDDQTDEGVQLTFYRDADADGYGVTTTTVAACSLPSGYATVPEDCDDADEDIHPGADEVCDEADNDCNEAVDDDAIDASPYYPDADQDGFGAAGSEPLYACARPENTTPPYADADDDCNDRDDDIYPAAPERCDGIDTDCDGNPDNGVSDAKTWHPDADQDGYGDANRSLQACSAPTLEGLRWIEDGRDCNDASKSVYPGATESCNGVDDDCNQVIDDGQSLTRFFRDADQDGYGTANDSLKACVAPSGYVSVQGDCDDANPNIYPGAAESCDTLDNNCNGSVDEGLTKTFYKDGDGDGYGDPQQSLLACPTPTGYVSNSTDCNDGNAQVNPKAVEQCNGLDDNCNAQVDEGVSSTWYQDADKDGHGNPTVTKSACARPDGYLASPTDDCNDNNPAIYPGAVETCDTLDNNCNGTPDEGVTTTFYRDADDDGYGSPSSTVQACQVPAGYASNALDCNDADASINPDAIEVCDGKDQDCNQQLDEGLPTQTYYKDGDGDGYGLSSSSKQDCKVPSGYVTLSGDCNDADKAIYPGAPETCNGKDDSCDGATDEGLSAQTYYKDGDGDGYGLSSSSKQDCKVPSGYVTLSGDCNDADKAIYPGATEVCNGKDDNCNGQVDVAEPGITCTPCEVGSGKTYAQLKDALRVSACKEILVYPGTYSSVVIQKAGPLLIRSTGGAAQTFIDANKAGTGIAIQNSSSVVVGNDVLIDGFTIKNGTGQPDPAGTTALLGGGIYVGAGAAPTLKNLTVISSSATYGGGIFIDGTCPACTQSPVLEELIVGRSGEGNTATVGGGGIHIQNVPTNRPVKLKGSLIKVEGNKIDRCATDLLGGGIRLFSSSVDVSVQTLAVVANSVTDQGCSNQSLGGGIHSKSSTIKLTGTSLQVVGNFARGYLGGIGLDSSTLTMDSTSTGLIQSNSTYYYEAGGLGIWNNSTATLNGLTFDKNSAGRQGGAIHIYNSPGATTVNNCTFTGNKSGTTYSGSGGAIYTDSGSLTLTHSRFEGNSAGNGGSGGAVYATGNVTLSDTSFTSNSAGGSGGAVYATGNVTLSDTSFTSNSAGGSGGAVYAGGSLTASSDLTLKGHTAGASGGALYVVGSVNAGTVSLTFLENKASGGSGGAVYAGGSLTASRVLVGKNVATQTSGSTNPTCAGIHMKAGGSITQALFWGNKAVNGKGGILCVEGSGAVLDSVVFSSNQVSSGQASAGSLYLTGSGHKVQNLTLAYTENLLKTGSMAEINNFSSGLNLLNTISEADTGDYSLDFGLSSTSPVTNVANNLFYYYGVSGCTGDTGGCGREDLDPSFLSSTDDNNLCDEDYHLSSSNDPAILSYGAYGTNPSWDDSLPSATECP